MGYQERKNRLTLGQMEFKALPKSETDIDISEADYTGFIDLLTIKAEKSDIEDMIVDFNLDKQTTGVNDVATDNDVCTLALYSNVGTGVDVRKMTLTGTAGSYKSDIGGWRFRVGYLAKGEEVKFKVKLSAERGDCEIPYQIKYRGLEAPKVTEVAAA